MNDVRAPIHNLVPEIGQISAGDYVTPQASLRDCWEADVHELNARLTHVAELPEGLVPQTNALKQANRPQHEHVRAGGRRHDAARPPAFALDLGPDGGRSIGGAVTFPS